MKQLRVDRLPDLSDNPYLYEIYDQKIDERIEKLFSGAWDDIAMTWHEAGEIDDETLYRWIEEEACEQIYKEITNE
jgi:hypothetical protein